MKPWMKPRRYPNRHMLRRKKTEIRAMMVMSFLDKAAQDSGNPRESLFSRCAYMLVPLSKLTIVELTSEVKIL